MTQLRGHGLDYFWFVHKDPGWRLRFGFRPPLDVLARLESVLQELRAREMIAHWFRSPYEPELFLFGGLEAVRAIHRYFDSDTAAWLLWQERPRKEPRQITAAVLTLAVLVDLFRRCVPAQEELWDVWCNLERIYGAASERPDDIPVVGLAHLSELCGQSLQPVLDVYTRANAALAEQLGAIWRAGQLLVGIRAILPSVAAFHWNRYSVQHATITQLVAALAHAYNPRRDLIGGSLARHQ